MNAARPLPVVAALLLGAAAAAQQRVDADEFQHLEPVLQRAIAAAAPFVVTVETFGGTRRVLGPDVPIDGDGPPRPRPAPKAKPPEPPEQPEQPEPPAPEGEPVPEGDKKDGEPKDGERKPDADKKPKLPLVPEGFQQTRGKTTGVVLTADGWILVSRFALNFDPTTVLITVPGRGTFHAERAGEDTSRGLALVKIAAEGLPVPTFVPPAEVAVGQWAFALGRTFAADEPTVHLGIVSAKKRLYGRALQIDAYTSPANYGGAVVDVHGRVLGIAVPLSPSGRNAGVEWYDSGIGFAVTIADIPDLLARMQQGQVLQRGWLGVHLEPSHLGPGAKIAGAPKDGAAAAAGLRKGDVVVALDGIEVQNGPHLQMLLGARLGGDTVTLTWRDDGQGEPIQKVVTLLDAPWSEQKRDTNADLPASFPLPAPEEGR
ncbi:MAG: trypsin-like peptidase domain-containing protein [Planctomycetes bacterium]|nr:trypsin-like peptidase domain-containing protein [Planctomycetota bacterium]